MKTIKDIQLDGQTVILRADYNVPLEGSNIADDYRIIQSLPTLNYLIDHGCRVVIISHLGRPDGKRMPEFSLTPVASRLSELLGRPVVLASDILDVNSVTNPVTLLENLRYWPGEESNDVKFAQRLAKLGTLFVQDGFGVVHRAHASTDALPRLLPSVAGLLLDTEVSKITTAMENPKRPLVAIMGGAKVSDKIALIERFIQQADRIIIGGAMANTFLKYQGYEIGKSKYESGQESTIKRILDAVEQKTKSLSDAGLEFLWLPVNGAIVAGEINASAASREVPTDEVGIDDYILDNVIPAEIIASLRAAGTIIWNGPIGMTEFPQFTQGSNAVAAAIRDSAAESIIGGGDTAAFVLEWDENGGKSFTHISTGGGAALELMSGKELPGLVALSD